MKSIAHAVSSTRLTLLGFALLALAVIATHADARVSGTCVAVPLVLLSLNLVAALARYRTLRRGGLGVFHVALLACLILLAIGRLTVFEGRVEIAEGSLFDAAAVETLSLGLLHPDGLASLRFEQGPIRVHYAPGLKRAHTLSLVTLHGAPDTPTQAFGDTTPLRLNGYRFYTTHNKGFAPLLTWTPRQGAPVTGALHMPSYPLFDWKQEQQWITPDGVPLRAWLRVPALSDEQSAWTLAPSAVAAVLVLELGGQRFELRPGDEAHGAQGSLRYERLIGWMGYRIHYDPTLLPLFGLALLAVLGLALHWWPAGDRCGVPSVRATPRLESST